MPRGPSRPVGLTRLRGAPWAHTTPAPPHGLPLVRLWVRGMEGCWRLSQIPKPEPTKDHVSWWRVRSHAPRWGSD